ncbi:hypothetical protein [Sphingomonas sp.]|uniref:hypothetical protein n=1 Tax=Sphingomonas sp. TaxID=28214 RepID=UPI003B007E3F
MTLKMMTALAAALGLAAGAAQAQTALGNSMGSESSSSATSVSSAKASGAHYTPVAKAARHQAMGKSHKAKSAMAAGTATGGSGDMTPSGNANPTNQH